MTQTAIFGPFLAMMILTLVVSAGESCASAAWFFVVFRVLHSAVHCTVNIVMLRFYLYAISSLAVWFMLARACLAQLGL